MPLSSLTALRWTTPINSVASVRFTGGLWRAYASLAGIQRGLRQSERARPQGYGSSLKDRRAARDSNPDGTRMTYKQRQLARQNAPKPTFKILKGKKDITRKPDEVRPQSRRSRFLDNKDSFGQKSMVYKFKTGEMQAELKALQAAKAARSSGDEHAEIIAELSRPLEEDERRPERGGRFGQTDDSRQGAQDRRLRRFDSEGDRDRRPRRFESDGDQDRRPRRFESGGDRPRRSDFGDDRPTRSSDYGRDRPNQGTYSRVSWDRGSRSEPQLHGAERRLSERPKEDNLSLPFTTAASQFLYGTSVVRAALQEGRRKMYKLYIYGGPNRQNLDQDVGIQRMAERQGIRTQYIPYEKVLDKMSGGRPHNGYLLEASPLPQLPITGLGEFSSSGNDRGYKLNLSWQSAEDADINGSSDYVPTLSRTHKPLVVVLDQVKDPGNLGAILRAVGFLGAAGVAITKRCSASLTPVALKASAGASEALNLYSVESVPRFLDQSRENGWKVYAATPAAYKSRQDRHMDLHQLQDADPLAQDPCILLIGSEGDGLSKGLTSRADFEVNIPNFSGSRVVDSLNVSVATGVLCAAFAHGQAKAHATAFSESKLF